MSKQALVVGASGIIGAATVEVLVEAGWQVSGLARRPASLAGVESIAADLQDPAGLAKALQGKAPSHVFFTSWLRQANEAENIRVNAGMVRNLLDALRPAGSLQHVALVTGLKHYLGPFEAYAQGGLPQTPFREEQSRLAIENFYYAQEDEVFAAAERDGFRWSVHRPHTVIGKAVGNAMNMGTTLAVYATICRETGRPFRFPGSAAQWNGLTDMTEAHLLARHMLWAASTPAAANQAFNVVDGDIFRWNWMWFRLADWFDVKPEPFDGTVRPLQQQMEGDAPIWREIAGRHQLAEPDIERLTNPWHTDADLGRPIEVVTDMSKSRRLGFNLYQPTDDAFFALFQRLRQDRLIPLRLGETMRTARLTLAFAVTLAGSTALHTNLLQAEDAPPQGADAVIAQVIATPEACRQRLEARQATFAFTPPVAEGECGIPLPVSLQALTIGADTIAFGAQPVLDCRLAERLADWIGNVVEPLARNHLGSGLAAVETGPGYACRKRNNLATGKLSEHAKGNALDIAAFTLRDGSRIAVHSVDPPTEAVAAFLAAVRITACGYFLTVLGPGSDAAHAEHLHLDLGPHGRTPNYRICQ